MVVSLKCFYCGISTTLDRRQPSPPTHRTQDHMVPRSRGGLA